MKNKEALVGIADQIKELDNLEKEIYQLKQEKGGLEHSVNLLKKNRAEELSSAEKERQEKQDEIAKLEEITNTLQAKRDALTANTAPEIAQLNFLRQQVVQENSALERKQENINKGFENLSKEQAKIEEKKEILKHIQELTEQL